MFRHCSTAIMEVASGEHRRRVANEKTKLLFTPQAKRMKRISVIVYLGLAELGGHVSPRLGPVEIRSLRLLRRLALGHPEGTPYM